MSNNNSIKKNDLVISKEKLAENVNKFTIELKKMSSSSATVSDSLKFVAEILKKHK